LVLTSRNACMLPHPLPAALTLVFILINFSLHSAPVNILMIGSNNQVLQPYGARGLEEDLRSELRGGELLQPPSSHTFSSSSSSLSSSGIPPAMGNLSSTSSSSSSSPSYTSSSSSSSSSCSGRGCGSSLFVVSRSACTVLELQESSTNCSSFAFYRFVQ
jgi:hypothetical protein